MSFNEKNEQEELLINEEEFLESEIVEDDETAPMGTLVALPKDEPQEEKQEEVEDNGELSEEDANEVFGDSEGLEVSQRIITKQFVYEYIESAKYADKVELNKRENYNSANWPVADTHYALGTDKQCFIYVYETKNPTVLLIYNTPEYAEELKKDHPLVCESKVPRSNTPWYKLIMDDTYTEDQVKKIIDDCFAYAYVIKEEEPEEEIQEEVQEEPIAEEPVVEEEPVQEETPVEESPVEEEPVQEEEEIVEAEIEEDDETAPVAALVEEPVEEVVEEAPQEEPVVEEDEVEEISEEDEEDVFGGVVEDETAEKIITKQFVYEYLEGCEYADKVKLNKRENYNSANWPVPDTHFACGDKEKCFVYVYETKKPTVLLIFNTPEYAEELKKDHPQIKRSKVPNNAKETWFNLVMDETYTEDQVKQILDDAFAHAYRVAEEEAAEEAAELAKQEEVVEEPEQEVTLKESLAAAATISHTADNETIDKKFIYDYLDNKYGKDVELNTRENFTSTGLPLADTHYVAGKKKKCFVYVYETNGTTLLLINNTSAYEKQLKKEHKLVTKSAFPKSKDEWFSVIIDDSFSKAQVQKVLDDCFVFNGGTAKEEIVVEPEIKTYSNSAFEEKKATDEVKYDYQEAVDAQNEQIKEEQEAKPKKAPKKVNEDDIWGRVVFNKKEEPKAEPVKEEKPKAKKASSTAAPKKEAAPKAKAEEPKKETKAKAEPAKKETKPAEKKPVEKKAEPKAAPKTEKTTKENKNIDKEKTTMADEEKIIQEGDNTKPHGKFVIRKTDKDNFVFKLISSNKRVVAIGAEAYASLQGAKGGIESIRKNAATAPIQDSTLQKVVELKFPKWEIYTDKKGEFRLRLYAANGNIVATTNDGYNQKTGAKGGIDAVARACIGSEIVRNDNPRAY